MVIIDIQIFLRFHSKEKIHRQTNDIRYVRQNRTYTKFIEGWIGYKKRTKGKKKYYMEKSICLFKFLFYNFDRIYLNFWIRKKGCVSVVSPWFQDLLIKEGWYIHRRVFALMVRFICWWRWYSNLNIFVLFTFNLFLFGSNDNNRHDLGISWWIGSRTEFMFFFFCLEWTLVFK